MTEQKAQNIIAFLELARTAIDNAELRVAGFPDGLQRELALAKTISEVKAAASVLTFCAAALELYREDETEKPKDAATVDRPTAGKPVVS